MRKIIYFGLLLCTVFLFFIFNEPIVGGVFVFLILYGVFSFFYLHTGSLPKIRFHGMTEFVKRDQEVMIRIEVENPSKRPRNFALSLGVTNQKMKEIHTIQGSVDGEKTKTICLNFGSSHCGNIYFTVEKLQIFDYVGLFSRTIKKKKLSVYPLIVGVLPDYEFLPVEISRRTKEYVQEAEDYTPSERGDDPAEIYQIRPYEKRDPLHNIHWKMTAKQDELMVKEQGKPKGCVVLVWIALSYPMGLKKTKKKKDSYLEGYDRVMEILSGVAFSLVACGISFVVAWYEESNDRIVKYRVKKEENVYELLHQVLYIESYEENENVAIRKQDAFRGQSYSTEIALEAGTILQGGYGTVQVNGEMVGKLNDKKNQNEEIFLTV